jgi:hypothetical protein
VYLPKIVEQNGSQVLAIIVLGSELRPHFAGPSYVRKGSETLVGSEEQFAELIAGRNSKANKILSFKSKKVTVVNRQQLPTPPAASESEWPGTTLIADCNQFWVTLKHIHQLQERAHSFPLSRVEINLDDGRNRLKVELAR